MKTAMKTAAVDCRPLGELGALGELAHVLIVIAAAKSLPAGLPGRDQFVAALARKGSKPDELAKTPLSVDTPQGQRIALLMAAPGLPRFERLVRLRKALAALLDESPKALAIHAADAVWADDACYVALLGGALLPAQKRETRKPLARIHLHSPLRPADVARTEAVAAGNCLARELTALPHNVLTPTAYRRRIRDLAAATGLEHEEFDFAALRKMGAGAFCAVAQGSPQRDAAIVHLRWRPRGKARRRVALVGKGICFDTGGMNLKTARYMQNMHEDMGGSAVALGLLQACARRNLPIAIDAWLAIARNHLSPQAYAQSDVVTALDGTTIEVVHTDAEGRMVLADALTMAVRARPAPDLVIDFATLTGSMVVALGTRHSGVFASEPDLAAHAVEAGASSGERVVVLPMAQDYDAALESKVADTLQCTMDGEADHILAARFLQRFVDGRPWLHVDLSAVNCKGGLGAVGTDLTGFGVAWGADLLDRWMGS